MPLPTDEYTKLKRQQEAARAKAKAQATMNFGYSGHEAYAFEVSQRQQKQRKPPTPQIHSYNHVRFAQAMHGMPPAAMKKPKQGYDRSAFVHAAHGMPPTKRAPAPNMPQNLGPNHQEYWRRRQAQLNGSYRQVPVRTQSKRLPKPEYSNLAFRKEYAYRPGVSGKAGEVLGMTNKHIHRSKPAKKEKRFFSSKPSKPSKPQYASPPRSRFSWDDKKSRKTYGHKCKKSSGCVIM